MFLKCDTMGGEYILQGPKLLVQIPENSIGQQFYSTVLKYQDLPIAFIDAVSESSISYKELLGTTCCLANALRAKGYRKGAVIGIFSENNIHYFTPVLAALYLGCTVTSFTASCTTGELLHLCNISKPSIIFCSKTTLSTVLQIRHELKFLKELVLINTKEGVNGANSLNTYIPKNISDSTDPLKFKPVDVDCYNDVAFILYSSGTTGLPKGILITHRNISMNLAIHSDPRYCINHKSNPKTIVALMPFCHSFGLSVVLRSLAIGYKAVVLAKFDRVTFLKTIQKYKILMLYIVPPIGSFLASTPLLDAFGVSSLEYIICGAARLSLDVERRLKQKLVNLKHIQEAYGSTETFTLTSFTVNDSKTSSCGKLVPQVSAKVVDNQGTALGPNYCGELYFKGESIMKGYLDESQSMNLARDKNGWFASGDVGYYDNHGYFFLTDRMKDLIKYKAHQVPPTEIETVLLSHPEIVDAVVVGLPHESVGQLPCAFVVAKTHNALTEDEVKNFVAERLSPPKWIRGGVRFIQEIPKTASGKILRKDLIRLLESRSKL